MKLWHNTSVFPQFAVLSASKAFLRVFIACLFKKILIDAYRPKSLHQKHLSTKLWQKRTEVLFWHFWLSVWRQNDKILTWIGKIACHYFAVQCCPVFKSMHYLNSNSDSNSNSKHFICPHAEMWMVFFLNMWMFLFKCAKLYKRYNECTNLNEVTGHV